MRFTCLKTLISSAVVASVCSIAAYAENAYLQHNLISDIPDLADHTDANLVNPWGIDRSPSSPWWVNAADKGLSLVYDATGAPAPAASPLVVSIPNSGGDFSAPTAVMFNPTSDFRVGTNLPATFLFVTEEGAVAGWNRNVNATQAVIMVPANGSAGYKGATLGQILGNNVLYAANFHAGRVDVYDSGFHLMNLPEGAFTDNRIPAGFAPFNVQNIGRTIFVTYAKQDADKADDVAGPGLGYVDAFTQDGTLILRFEHNKFLNAPWGVEMAPSNFGKLSNMLLVGQFGSGQILAFDPYDGSFQGRMKGAHGTLVQIEGLWGIKFGNGGSAGPSNVLFFSAGIEDESHGLFGSLTSSKAGDGANSNSGAGNGSQNGVSNENAGNDQGDDDGHDGGGHDGGGHGN